MFASVLIGDRGVPYICVFITASISLLTYLSCSSGSAVVFQWFQNLVTIASLFTWVSVAIAYIQFHKALKAQGIDRDTLVFRSHFQPYSAYFALFFFTMIILFNGFYTFQPFLRDDFITAYVGIPIYFALFLFWKIFKGTKFVNPAEADIFTGKAALDAVHWPEKKAKNWLQKIWYWIA
jgi:yeast amino acid transporter